MTNWRGAIAQTVGRKTRRAASFPITIVCPRRFWAATLDWFSPKVWPTRLAIRFEHVLRSRSTFGRKNQGPRLKTGRAVNMEKQARRAPSFSPYRLGHGAPNLSFVISEAAASLLQKRLCAKCYDPPKGRLRSHHKRNRFGSVCAVYRRTSRFATARTKKLTTKPKAKSTNMTQMDIARTFIRATR